MCIIYPFPLRIKKSNAINTAILGMRILVTLILRSTMHQTITRFPRRKAGIIAANIMRLSQLHPGRPR